MSALKSSLWVLLPAWALVVYWLSLSGLAALIGGFIVGLLVGIFDIRRPDKSWSFTCGSCHKSVSRVNGDVDEFVAFLRAHADECPHSPFVG